jgi:hypothetical protein
MPKIHSWRYSSQNPDDVIMGYASNSSVEDEYIKMKRELEAKTVKELHSYFKMIGGDEVELKGMTKAKIVKHIIKFAKMIAGDNNNSGSASEGGMEKRRKRKTRKAKRTTSFFGLF